MPKYERHKTRYPGVYYIIGKSTVSNKPEKIYYIQYRLNGRQVEERAGRQILDAMTPSQASLIRAARIKGERIPNKEKRIQQQNEPKQLTFDKLWNEYEAAKGHLKGLTHQRNQYYKHVSPSIGSMLPEQLTASDIDRLRSQLHQNQYAPQSIKHILSQINRLVNFGASRGLCDPLGFKMEYPKFDNTKTEYLTTEQRNKLLQVLEDEANIDLSCFLKVVMFTGMRKMEVLKLQWHDVDLDNNFILIRDPKGIRGETIPVNKHTREALITMKEKYDSDFVFPSPHGGVRDRSAFVRQLRRIRNEVGLPDDFRMVHGMRHSFATYLAEQGVDLYVIQKMLGHKHYQTTQRYAHLTDKTIRKASDVADKMV